MSKKNDVLYFSNIRSPFQWYFSWWRYRVNKVALAKKYDKKLYNRYKKRISFFETIDGANFKIKDNSYFRRWVDFQLSTNPIYGSMTSNIIKYWFCNNAELFLDNYYNNPLDNYII